MLPKWPTGFKQHFLFQLLLPGPDEQVGTPASNHLLQKGEGQNHKTHTCSSAAHKCTYFHVLLNVHVLSKHHYVGWVYYQQENILSGPVKPITVWIQGRGFHLLTTLFLGLWEILKRVSRWELLPHIKWVLIMWYLLNNFFLGDLTRKLVWILNNIFNWY